MGGNVFQKKKRKKNSITTITQTEDDFALVSCFARKWVFMLCFRKRKTKKKMFVGWKKEGRKEGRGGKCLWKGKVRGAVYIYILWFVYYGLGKDSDGMVEVIFRGIFCFVFVLEVSFVPAASDAMSSTPELKPPVHIQSSIASNNQAYY